VRRIDADDASLLLAASNGDDRAFAAFYRRWLPVVTGYQLRRTRSRAQCHRQRRQQHFRDAGAYAVRAGGWPTTTVWRAADGHVVKTIDEPRFDP